MISGKDVEMTVAISILLKFKLVGTPLEECNFTFDPYLLFP